jgi:hypothetical protein
LTDLDLSLKLAVQLERPLCGAHCDLKRPFTLRNADAFAVMLTNLERDDAVGAECLKIVNCLLCQYSLLDITDWENQPVN